MILLIMQDPDRYASRSPLYWDLTNWKETDGAAADVDVLYVEDYWYHLDLVEWCAERGVPVIKIEDLEDPAWEPMCKATRALQILQLITYNTGLTAATNQKEK